MSLTYHEIQLYWLQEIPHALLVLKGKSADIEGGRSKEK